MQFYCANCQQIVDANPESTITTKFNQTAHKAHCPICTTDMAVYGAIQQESVSVVAETTQTEVDSVLKEFSQTVS